MKPKSIKKKTDNAVLTELVVECTGSCGQATTGFVGQKGSGIPELDYTQGIVSRKGYVGKDLFLGVTGVYGNFTGYRLIKTVNLTLGGFYPAKSAPAHCNIHVDIAFKFFVGKVTVTTPCTAKGNQFKLMRETKYFGINPVKTLGRYLTGNTKKMTQFKNQELERIRKQNQ